MWSPVFEIRNENRRQWLNFRRFDKAVMKEGTVRCVVSIFMSARTKHLDSYWSCFCRFVFVRIQLQICWQIPVLCKDRTKNSIVYVLTLALSHPFIELSCFTFHHPWTSHSIILGNHLVRQQGLLYRALCSYFHGVCSTSLLSHSNFLHDVSTQI